MSHSKKISLISRLHYLKLVFRSLLFLAAAAAYVIRRVRGIPFSLNSRRTIFMLLNWKKSISLPMVLCWKSASTKRMQDKAQLIRT